MNGDAVRAKLTALEIETPSWGYGNSGTRFHVYPWPGAARNVWERIDDAALVHQLTGCCPSVALHIPWDKTDDWKALGQEAKSLGVKIGAVNPNLFQDDNYKLGSVCHPSSTVQEQAISHMVECCEIMRATGSDLLSRCHIALDEGLQAGLQHLS